MPDIFFGGNKLLNARKILKKVPLEQNMVVADLGCGGAAHFTLPAAKMVGDKGKVFAVDVLKFVLDSVQSWAKMEGITNIKTIWADLEIFGSTYIKSLSLEAVLLINILFQSRKHLNIFKEAVRILKPGGKLLVIDWKLTQIPFGPPPEIRVKKEEVKAIAHQLGLEKINEFSAGTYHFGLIFQKPL
jgi:ubiquinone/menaquinone biosynthesis C-methylase UbiE